MSKPIVVAGGFGELLTYPPILVLFFSVGIAPIPIAGWRVPVHTC